MEEGPCDSAVVRQARYLAESGVLVILMVKTLLKAGVMNLAETTFIVLISAFFPGFFTQCPNNQLSREYIYTTALLYKNMAAMRRVSVRS